MPAHFCPVLVCPQKATMRIQFLSYFWNPLIKYTWKTLSNSSKYLFGYYNTLETHSLMYLENTGPRNAPPCTLSSIGIALDWGKIGLAGEKIMPNSLAHKKLTNSREIFWLFWLKPSLHQNSRLELKLRYFLLKNYVSQEILNWHSLRHSHSADICILFYCQSWLRQARQRKMIQSSALWLCLRLCQFKISWDT